MKKTLVPKTILNKYDLGTVKQIKQIQSGLIHQTFLIQSSRGKYILQKLHPIIANQNIAKDFFAVTSFLKENKFLSPESILTKKGEIIFVNGKDSWRMQTHISGKTIHRITTQKQAREAGKLFAKFHITMSRINYTFKTKKVLHDSEKIFQTFVQVVKKNKNKKIMKEVESEVDLIMRQMPKHFLPKTLPLKVVHGDPKISNILFDQQGSAKSIIDLDTCSRRTVLVELGDAFRSWCAKEEDDPKNTFSLKLFKSAWSGYTNATRLFLTKKEQKEIPKAIGLITLELASRFLVDYFEDKYFGWDENKYISRREHNLARCRGQLAEFKDFVEKKKKVKKIIS